MPDLLADNGHDRADLRLIRRAVTRGWAIPDEMFTRLPEVCREIALDENRSERHRLRAIELMMAMWHDRVTAAIELAKLEARETISRGELEDMKRQIIGAVIDLFGADGARRLVSRIDTTIEALPQPHKMNGNGNGHH